MGKQQTFSGLVIVFGLGLAGCGGASEPDVDASASASSSQHRASDTSAGPDSPEGPDPGVKTESPSTRSITIAASGDVLPHASVLESAAQNAASDGSFDFTPMFASVAPLLSGADLALCHLETPLSADNTGLTHSGVLSFASPHELAEAIADAGFDGCDFASNHTMDRGLDGLVETEDVMRDAGLGYAGPTGHQDRAGRAASYDADGVEVAHLAYTYTLPNEGDPNTSVPSEAPWLRRALWPVVGSDGIRKEAARARADGAEVVIVSMHWGQEYESSPTKDQTEIAQDVMRSGEVDLILGTHVHVPQPCAKIDDRFVLYGMGNMLSNQSPDVDRRLRTETQEGMVALIELTLAEEGKVSSTLKIQPTRVDLDGHVVMPVGPGLHPETAERTMDTLTSLGSCHPTVVTR